MNQPKAQKRANAMMNDEFISIETYSGYFNFLDDPEAPEHLLAANASEEEIGRALLDALSRSRILIPKENREFFSFERAGKRYEEWVKKIMACYGYKKKRAMFVNLKNCWIHWQDDLITLKPTNHVKLEAWEGKRKDEIVDVVIPGASSAIEVGKALKEAFSRCG
jgi:hypothetical protein